MKNKNNISKQKSDNFLFDVRNYKITIIGIVLIIIGYILMVGGELKDPNVFDIEKIFSFRQLTLSVIVCLTGFGICMYAIFLPPKKIN